MIVLSRRVPVTLAPPPEDDVPPREGVVRRRVRGAGYCSSCAPRPSFVSLPAPPSAALAREILK